MNRATAVVAPVSGPWVQVVLLDGDHGAPSSWRSDGLGMHATRFPDVGFDMAGALPPTGRRTALDPRDIVRSQFRKSPVTERSRTDSDPSAYGHVEGHASECPQGGSPGDSIAVGDAAAGAGCGDDRHAHRVDLTGSLGRDGRDIAGTYEIGCHQPGHYATGMKMNVTVE